MPKKVQTPDGKHVMVFPHSTDGRPDYGHEDYASNHALQRRVFAYQDMIHKVLNDYDLWQYMEEAGRMSMEYRNIRKADPLMPELVRLVKLSIAGKLPHRIQMQAQYRELVPEEYWDYPFPGPIMRRQGIDNADWITDQEMKDIWAFALENRRENPWDPNSKMFKSLKGLLPEDQAQIIGPTKIKLYRDDQKRNKIIIPGGAALRFTLFDDPELPRGGNIEGLHLVKYDHTNPLHNPELRSHGVFQDMRAYAGPVAGPVHAKRKVMDVDEAEER